MSIFDDYIKKEQAEEYRKQQIQRDRETAAGIDADLARTLTPYVAEALKEIGSAAGRLYYNYDYFENTYVTGTIFKKTERTLSCCWMLRQLRGDGSTVRDVPSKVLFTTDDQFITPYKQDGVRGHGEPAHYQGTKVSLDRASSVVAEEMVSSINALKFFMSGKGSRPGTAAYRDSIPGLVDRCEYREAVKMYFEWTLRYIKNKSYTDVYD